jgi:hypothetical protein
MWKWRPDWTGYALDRPPAQPLAGPLAPGHLSRCFRPWPSSASETSDKCSRSRALCFLSSCTFVHRQDTGHHGTHIRSVPWLASSRAFNRERLPAPTIRRANPLAIASTCQWRRSRQAGRRREHDPPRRVDIVRMLHVRVPAGSVLSGGG